MPPVQYQQDGNKVALLHHGVHCLLPLDITMGSCISQQQELPALHERLDEHDDDYFARVETRNSFESKPKWWRKYRLGVETSPLSESDSFWGQDHPTLATTDEETHVVRSPFSAQAVLASPFTATTQTTAASSASLVSTSTRSAKSGTLPKTKEFESDERNVRGWQVRRQGHALQLRLAKHRFLQIAASRQSSYDGDDGDNDISPLSLDSSFFPASDNRNLGVGEKSQRSPGARERKVAFGPSNGMLWKEITCEHKVTAVALSRKFEDYPVSPPRKLLLAMGDETGMIRVTQLLDDALLVNNPTVSQQAEAVEFSVQGRIRSMDFGNHRSLVVGGDGKSYSSLWKISHCRLSFSSARRI